MSTGTGDFAALDLSGQALGREARPTAKFRARVLYGYLLLLSVTLIGSRLLGPVATEAVLSAVFVGALATLSAKGLWNFVSWGTAAAASVLVALTVAQHCPRLDPSPEIAWAVAFLRLASFITAFYVAIGGGGSSGQEKAVWAHLVPLLRMPLVLMGLYLFALYMGGLMVLSHHFGMEIGPRL